MDDLILICYSSSASPPLEKEELESLLERARVKNARLGITGALIYREGSFLQFIEGSPAAVDTLYEAVSRDPRHHMMVRLLRRPIKERCFAEWSMGFKEISEDKKGIYSGLAEGTEESNEYWDVLPRFVKILTEEFLRVNR